MTTQANNVAIESSQINSSGVLQPAGGGTGVNISTTDLSVNGLTVGKGGGSVIYNTAVGYQAINATATGIYNVGVGYSALSANTSGEYNTAVGGNALQISTTGVNNSAFGVAAMAFNTSGSYNTALGMFALHSDTTASNNTAVGYQAGYTNSTGTYSTYVGWGAGYSATGGYNTCVGQASGYYITTGTKNSILGAYNGNQGGLDIRTSSNYIVLSDGDGNPRGIFDNNGNYLVGTVSNVAAPARAAFIGNSTYGGLAAEAPGSGGGYPIWFRDTDATSASQQLVNIRRGASVVGYITTTNTTTSYQSASDYRLKEDVASMTGALAKLSQLNPVTYKWKIDGSDGQGFIAHELAEVFPDAVSGEKDAVDKEGNILPQAIDQSKLVATLVAAIQELKAEVDSLKQQLGK
jgi:hypothetical protein